MEEHAVPVLPSRDLAETQDFYGRLGFETSGLWPEEGYLIVTRGTVQLHFFHDPAVDPLTTSAGCYVYVADADALFAEWRDIVVPDAATGSRLVPPEDRDYGLRELALVDRSGNLLRLGSRLD